MGNLRSWSPRFQQALGPSGLGGIDGAQIIYTVDNNLVGLAAGLPLQTDGFASLKVLDERVSATTAALVAMLLHVGIVYAAEDRTALRLRVYVDLTQGNREGPHRRR
jgi:hypothetical protein